MSEVPPEQVIPNEEPLSRFITQSSWFRPSDNTPRPEAFIPYPYPDLSVTRHGVLSQEEIWNIGQKVAQARPATLHGRADITAGKVRQAKLEVEPKPIPENLNHASIFGWPSTKPAQKSFAQELAAAAKFLRTPVVG